MRIMERLLSKITKRRAIFVLCCFSILLISISYCYSAFYTRGNIVASSDTITISNGFVPTINGSGDFNQYIYLEDTITNNKNLAPGARGTFNLDVNLSKVSGTAKYTISYDDSNLPTNLHFYTDSSLTIPLTTISNTMYDSSERTDTNTIYWEWEYVNSLSSNENDNLFMNQTISIPFTISIVQLSGD